MLEIFFIILVLIFISKFIEDRLKIPFVLVVIILSYGANYFFDLSVLGRNFEEIIYMMLPIILIPDVLGISRSELEENAGAIFYLAFVAVVLSIIAAVGITFYIDKSYHHLSLIALTILFTPLMATDVISVSAIFAKFKLPEKLKLFAEGESLFNDITAMIIFFFIAIPLLNGQNLSFHSLLMDMSYTLIVSMLIGVSVGLISYELFKIARDTFEEFIVIYIMASFAFLLADYYHLSGILAVVISILLFKYLFDKEGHYKKKNYNAILKYFNTQSSSDSSFRAYKKEAYYLGLFANAVIFISIANVIDIDLLLKYKMEILYTFLLTSVIRYFVILPLIFYKKLSLMWNNILTLSGMKGGLALIMIIALPDSFAYKEMFLAIVLGVVILSIFLYTFILMSYMYFQKDKLIIDKAKEHHLVFKDLKELLEKEEKTGAYNEIVFEDFVEKEISRAQRYQYDFSIVAFHKNSEFFQKLRLSEIRQSDYFGKLNSEIYAILLTHSDIKEATIFIHKFIEDINQVAVTQYETGDTKEMLYEKLYDLLHHNITK
ncbi:Na+/H+ antiporter [hydrothermal vent metagenome]|uniref:Na+/H+ antiporter n=1 Tax=hydrothermal vent metagenome TaxID=652676 RepID=A0A1W1D4D2_9ZZZZ